MWFPDKIRIKDDDVISFLNFGHDYDYDPYCDDKWREKIKLKYLNNANEFKSHEYNRLDSYYYRCKNCNHVICLSGYIYKNFIVSYNWRFFNEKTIDYDNFDCDYVKKMKSISCVIL